MSIMSQQRTRRAPPPRRSSFVIVQSVKNTAVSVESVLEYIKELAVLTFVMPEHRIGDQVRQLNQPRCVRIYEDGNLGKISDYAPLVPNRAKVMRQALNGCLGCRLIEDDHTTMRIACPMQSHQILIEPATNLLKAKLDRIARRDGCLVYNNAECAVTIMGGGKYRKRGLHGADTLIERELTPPSLPVHHG